MGGQYQYTVWYTFYLFQLILEASGFLTASVEAGYRYSVQYSTQGVVKIEKFHFYVKLNFWNILENDV